MEIARDVCADVRYRKLLLAFTIFGTGNLMNFAVFPIMLVDHFDASNGFVGTLAIVQSATQIVAYPVIGRIIDRGSTLRQTLIATLLTLLVPIGYLVAPGTWALPPVAVSSASACRAASSRRSRTSFTWLPRARDRRVRRRERIPACVRGTAAPFAAQRCSAWSHPQVVLVLGTLLMTTGALVLACARARASAAASGGCPGGGLAERDLAGAHGNGETVRDRW